MRMRCIFFFMATTCSVPALNAQINAYARVTGINASKTQLTIANVNQTFHTFIAGEQVIVMQMQDDVIGSNTSNNSNFGRLSDIKSAGVFDVGTISSVNSTTITLNASLTNDYHINSRSRVQVVSFRKLSPGNYTTSSNITALAWNGSVGGVVAFQVGGTLTLAHAVTADGKGFRGGTVSSNYENGCEPSVYISSSSNYGGKGEGIHRTTNDGYARGRARLLNGGGGGSDDNAGGGGGGNITTGGLGGHGWTCESNPAGGLGGIDLKAYSNGMRAFMGGGGGGGQQNNGRGTPGGDGGGIILIRANMIRTNCSGNVRISANGITPVATLNDGNDGAGGGGAGGTIIVQVNQFDVSPSCPLQVTASGGNGGDVNHSGAHGGGGGGAQGAVVYSVAVPPANVTTNTNNGIGGFNNVGGARAGSASGSNNEGILTGINIILPINLLSFNAKRDGYTALLLWESAGDQGIDYYVQHSTDGIRFNNIAMIKASRSHNYRYIHRSPAAGKNYYRLKMVMDASGVSLYSPVTYLTNDNLRAALAVYPNPAREYFTLNVPGNSRQFTVTITDLTGKPVHSAKCSAIYNTLEVHTGSMLRPGSYIITVSGKNYLQTGRLVIR